MESFLSNEIIVIKQNHSYQMEPLLSHGIIVIKWNQCIVIRRTWPA